MNISKALIFFPIVAGVSVISFNASAAASVDVTLQGIITATTCDVTVNGGQSTLDVGVHKSADFTANNKVGNFSLPVELKNCSKDETGNLVINGKTSSGNSAQNIFVSNDDDTVGFMITDASSTTVTNSTGPQMSVTEANGGQYSFSVGMASTTADPVAGSYSAPITVSYIVN